MGIVLPRQGKLSGKRLVFCRFLNLRLGYMMKNPLILGRSINCKLFYFAIHKRTAVLQYIHITDKERYYA